jgi:FAD:protein FMN transferase
MLSKIGFNIAVLSIFLSGCYNIIDIQYYKERRVMMGTYLEVTCPSKEAATIAFDEIKRIEGLLSKYDPQSEISRLNIAGELKVSPDAFYVIKKAKEFWQASDGAFDITVAPLADLWGFTNKEYSVPASQDLARALTLVGSDKIALNENDNVIKFLVPGMKIDLGGLAKGYAVDCAIKKLKDAGVASGLINLGGQIFCLGNKSGRPWKIAIRDPRYKSTLDYELELVDRAVSTSGDYEQYFTKEGKRYCHIINPKNGYPVEAHFESVTVLAADGLTADALSTSMFILGRIKGQALLKRFPGAEAVFIDTKL